MEEFLSVLTGFLVPALVVLSIIMRIVNNAKKVADRKSSEERPVETGPSRTAYRPPSATYRTPSAPVRPVPSMTGSAAPPRRTEVAPRLSGSLDGGSLDAGSLEGGTYSVGSLEGGTLSVGSLEGSSMESRALDYGSLGGATDVRRQMGVRAGVEHRLAAVQDSTYRIQERGSGLPLFRPSRGTLVQGVLYAEILGRPGGRRASR